MKLHSIAKSLLLVVLLLCMALSLAGCAPKCKTGCGRKADPQCTAGMCDVCCEWWRGLNGCDVDHY